MKIKLIDVFALFILIIPAYGFAQVFERAVTLQEIETFLEQANLQSCRAEKMDVSVSQWHGSVASYWLEISNNCEKRTSIDNDIMHVHQFDNAVDRDRMISSYLSNRPRGIAINVSLWPVGEYFAIALIGRHQEKYREQVEQAFIHKLQRE